MKCHEARRRLDLFMDGELSVPENLTVLEHLNLCRPCASVYDGEKTLRASLKSELGREQAPASLHAALSGFGAPSPSVEVRRPRWSALAAAVFFLTLAASLLFTPTVETPRAFAAEASTKHVETRDGFCGRTNAACMCTCGTCSPDPDRPMEKFFRRHVPYDVCAHDLGKLGYSFAGAAVWPHRGGKVCWTVQQDGKGRSVTHALVATPLARPGGPVVLRDGPRPVVLAPAGAPGFTCVFIFDDAGELDRFLAVMGMRP